MNTSSERRNTPSLRLALVVQRYGEEVNGGAEYHCRLVAEHLAKMHRVEVLTSCATDYITWRNEHPEGLDKVNGIPVRRFKVKRARDEVRFGRISDRVLLGKHAEKDELTWLDEQGPLAPSLIRFAKRHRRSYDYFIFFSYRYYHSYHGVRALPSQSILVPTAEKDAVISLKIFEPYFHLPRAIIYNSYEERKMIWSATGNREVAGDVVGVGSDVPTNIDTDLFRKRRSSSAPYMIFIGRIDENKGCRTLFSHYRRFKEETGSELELILVGGTKMAIPDIPGMRHAGFLSDAEKWSALAGAKLLVIPSDFESLSMVTLEAWSIGKPVLANGRCDVLKDQCLRSNAGLYYENYQEFREALVLLEHDGDLRDRLGALGRQFFHEHYRWDVIEHKYNRLLSALHAEDAARAPARVGLLARWFGAASA